MQGKQSAAKQRLIEALTALRVKLASGPERHFTMDIGNGRRAPTGAGYVHDVDGGIAEAANIGAVKLDGKQCLYDPSVSERIRQDIIGFTGDIMALDMLPAPPYILRQLDELIESLGGSKMAAAQSDGPWSKSDGPEQWSKKFGFSVDTLMRRFKDGKIRYKKLSSKCYCIHVDDLPK